MKLFRVCKRQEVGCILRDFGFENVGTEYTSIEDNTHQYDKNKKYLHFFTKKKNIKYLGTMRNGMLLCTYDVPDQIAQDHTGIGKYYTIRGIEVLEECAIPTEELRYEYLLAAQVLSFDRKLDADFWNDDKVDKNCTLYYRRDVAESEK